MKTKYWLLIFAGVLLACGIAGALLLFSAPATHAQIFSGGQLLRTVDLSLDQEFTVTNGLGANTVTVSQGRIAVTSANCPDGYCMRRGFCDSGLQIVCLPNALVIRFTTAGEVDGVA